MIVVSVFFSACSIRTEEEPSSLLEQKEKTLDIVKKQKNEERKKEAEKTDIITSEQMSEDEQTHPFQEPEAEVKKEQKDNQVIKPEEKITSTPDLNELLEPALKKTNPNLQLPEKNSKDMDVEKLWEGVDDVAEVAQSYYTEFFSKTRLITKNGYLYNKAAESYVDVRYLCDAEYLDKKYLGYDYKVLLLYGSDVAENKELIMKESDKDLAVFIAYKHPKEDSYLIASSKSTGGILDGWKFRSLLEKYNQKHGTINRLFPNSQEYERILTFIKMYESKYDNYYVRSIEMDEKYAFVTLSSQVSTADVKQYILMKENGLWEVVMDNLENEPRLVVAVNKKFPDFNIAMLPAYTIYDYKSSIKTGFTDVLGFLIEEKQIIAVEDVCYLAGTLQYCYVVTTKGEHFLLEKEKGKEEWSYTLVSGAYEAANKMTENDKDAPTFILLDD